MNVIYFVWYFSIFYYTFSKILATNIDSITSYSKIREEIKSMYVCMYVFLSCAKKGWVIINLHVTECSAIHHHSIAFRSVFMPRLE